MKISVVSTLYQSAAYLEEFYDRVVAAIHLSAGVTSDDIEVVLVDDGSPDHSLVIAQKLLHRPEQVKVVALSRNFGHHPAILTGLAHTTGDLVFLIDCDLEEAPELFHDYFSTMQKEGPQTVDMIYGVQTKRKGGFFERLSGWLFYKFFNFVSSVPIPPNEVMAKLMTRRYVDALLKFKEREFHLSSVMRYAGFKHIELTVTKKSKETSAYNIARKLKMMIAAVTSFSSRPLILIFVLGVSLGGLTMVGIFTLLARIMFFGKTYLAGWSSLLLAISFFGSLILISLGILGLYLSHIFVEVKQRPVVVKTIVSNRT